MLHLQRGHMRLGYAYEYSYNNAVPRILESPGFLPSLFPFANRRRRLQDFVYLYNNCIRQTQQKLGGKAIYVFSERNDGDQ